MKQRVRRPQAFRSRCRPVLIRINQRLLFTTVDRTHHLAACFASHPTPGTAMRIVRALFWFLLLLIAGLVVGAFFVPERAAAERSIVIERPASVVYGLIDGYARFNEWSPWSELDPATVYSYEGPRDGVGARMTWASANPSVGRGEQTITEAEADSRIATRVVFDGRQESTSTMTLEPGADGTRVIWRLEADFPLRLDANFGEDLIGRWFSTLLDRFVGADYERGLAKLKALAESLPATDVAGLDVTLGEIAGGPSYSITGLEAGTDLASTNAVIGPAIAELRAFIERNGIALDGQPTAVVRGHGDGNWQFDVRIPVVRNEVAGEGRVTPSSVAAGRIVDVRHDGSWDALETTHAKAEAWLAIEGLRETGAREEHYLDELAVAPDGTVLASVRLYVE